MKMLQKTILINLLKKLRDANLVVTFWDGDKKTYKTNPKRPKVQITIKDPGFVKKLLKNASLAVGEAYMDETLLVDGPLEEFTAIGFRNAKLMNLGERFRGLNRNVKKLQRKYISYHYDIGNDFYKLWLDKETLGYTCSYYKSPKDTLETAQIQKFDHILNKLQLKKGMELLEIGFGWGYLLVRAAKRFGIRGYGVSLSKEQLEFANSLAKKAGVSHLVTFKLMNYQDLPKLKKQFDRVVSVGFMEHVGQGNHATYFKLVNKMLKDGGISVLHCITTHKEQPTYPWLDKYIFPGGYMPSIREITSLLPDFDFELKDYENIGLHYIPTLKEWWKRFESHKPEIIKMYDERFYRMWRFWLAASVASFQNGDIHLSQWVFTKGFVKDWPLTREYLYK